MNLIFGQQRDGGLKKRTVKTRRKIVYENVNEHE